MPPINRSSIREGFPAESRPRLTTWRPLGVIPLLILMAAPVACSGSGPLPIGKPAKGDSLIVTIEAVEKVQEIRFLGNDNVHYLVTPAGGGNELVALRIRVFNEEATRLLITIDEDAAELRGFGFKEKYRPLDLYYLELGTTVRTVEGTHPLEDRFLPFLAGPIEMDGVAGLPQGHAVRGWMVFEVPKGIKLREMRWEAGDNVYLSVQR